MQRILVTLLIVAFWAAAAVLSGAAQEFQRETDTIPVFIDGESVLNPFAGGIQWPRVVLTDIDSDGDFDLLVGDHDGSVHFYRNVGTVAGLRFELVAEHLAYILNDVGALSAPAFADIDDDGDSTRS